MTDLFLRVLDLSLGASWVVLAVLAARFCLKKAPKWMRCALWLLVAISLLCPVSMESKLSLVPEVSFSRTIPVQTEGIPQKAYGEILSSDGEVLVRKEPDSAGKARGEILSADGEVLASKPLQSAKPVYTKYDLLSWLWVAGVVVLLCYAAASYFRIRSKVQASIDLGNRVYLCDYIDSPFILGIFKPRIYLPSDIEAENAAYVLAHERAHLARRDHWWKPLGYWLLCLHWFNPLLWIAYVLLCQDIELACDEKVIRNFTISEKKEYSKALLVCSISHRRIAACPLAFGEVGVKQRVKSVLHYKKPGFWMLLAGVAAIVVVAVCFLTKPYEEKLTDLYPLPREDVTCIDFTSQKGQVCLSLPRERERIWQALNEIPYDPEPVSDTPITAEADEYGWGYPELSFFVGEESASLWFTTDYSTVWYKNESGASLPYSVQDPGSIQAMFEENLKKVEGITVTAQPFATMEEPEKWLSGVSMEAIASMRFNTYEGNSGRGGAVTALRAEELLDILNTIPAGALSEPKPIVSGSTEHVDAILSHDPNICIILEDRANQLAAVVRYHNAKSEGEKLELVLFDNMRYFEEWTIKILGAQKWELDSPELLRYMREFCQDPPSVVSFVGSQYDWIREPLSVNGGGVSMTLRLMEGWDAEIVEYTEGCESFGIRVKPKTEAEGWLYFSFWPVGYFPQEVNRSYNQNGIRGLQGYTSYPITREWSYGTGDTYFPWSYRRYPTDIGDYAIINEGADGWMGAYEDAIRCFETFFDVEGGTQTEFELPESVIIPVDYPQSDREAHYFHQFDMDTADRAVLNIDSNWVHEDYRQEYEDHIYFGAFWPVYETEGRITLEYWAGGFLTYDLQSDETSPLAYYKEYYPIFDRIGVDKNGSPCLVIDKENGSYVFRFEDTNSWSEFQFEMAVFDLSKIVFMDRILD